MSRILVDVDNVLCSFTEEFLLELYSITGVRKQESDVTDFDFKSVASPAHLRDVWRRVDTTPGFCADLPALPDIDHHLRVLRTQHEVIAVTAPRFGRYWMYERAQWLFDHGFREDTVVFTHNKAVISGSVLVDDRLENIQSWCAHNRHGWGFLVDRSWNQGDAGGKNWQRVPDLKTAVDLVQYMR